MVEARDLEIRHLMALDAVAATGTFGRAAARLGYTQSAVSQQIAGLERAVGEPLFDRPGGPRPVTLTPLGVLLLDHARDVLERVTTAAHDVQRFQAGVLGRIDVGTFQSVSTGLLPSILGRLRDERPELDARLLEIEDQDDLIRRVLDGQLDVTFVVHDTPPQMERLELFVDPFVVIARPEDVTADPVPIARLKHTSLIGQPDTACQRFVDDGLLAAGVQPAYVFRSSDNTAVAAMVRAGMGMAVLPLLAVEQHDPRIAVREIVPPIPPRHVAIAWRRDRTLSPAARRFIELAQELTADLHDRVPVPVG